jgi:broad specificity phosphatase PhoE
MGIYKHCGLLDTEKPEDTVIVKFSNFKAIVSSDLKRSIESASLLSSGNSLIIDPMFREVEDPFISIPLLKFTIKSWYNIYILLWFFGLFELKSGIREGKTRAKACAQKLTDLAEEYGKVLFVGHGFMNKYIAKELNLLGWEGPKMPSKKYWEYGVYQKNAT